MRWVVDCELVRYEVLQSLWDVYQNRLKVEGDDPAIDLMIYGGYWLPPAESEKKA